MYVNGYILAVPEDKKQQYTAVAKLFAEVAGDFGALEIYENWEHEVPNGEQTDFRRAVQALPNEKIVFSWVVWPDKETEAKAHKEMMNDPRFAGIAAMPFDGKRMVLGGFEPILAFHKT